MMKKEKMIKQNNPGGNNATGGGKASPLTLKWIDTPKLARDFANAIVLIELLVDEDDCDYDHNKFCQSHACWWPCVHGAAKEFLERVKELK